MRKTIIAILLILFTGSAALFSYPQFKRIEKKTVSDLQPVDALLPRDADAVAQAIQRTLGAKDQPLNNKFDHFRLAKPGDLYFPDDTQMQVYARKDPLLRAYLTLNPALKKNDFSLVAYSDYYWSSEYYYGNEPAKFRCNFIIHLAPKDNAHTKIEILEYEPRIWVGKKVGFSAHTGPLPGVFYDIRDVRPTTTDRIDLLDLIQKVVATKN
jgi:hypothetical protein